MPCVMPTNAALSPGLDFLRRHGARRTQATPTRPGQPIALEDNAEDEAPERPELKAPRVDLEYETPLESWKPRRISTCGGWAEWDDWSLRPQRFVDGKDVGRVVAWLRSQDGFPIPLRFSVIGAIAVSNSCSRLSNAWSMAQPMLSMVTSCFEPAEVAAFRDALAALPTPILLQDVACPVDEMGWDWERVAGRTRAESRRQMLGLEKKAIAHQADVPTLVDGRLDDHAGGFSFETQCVLGLIKNHRLDYFSGQDAPWQAFYDLEPGERTPVFAIELAAARRWVVTWFVRLCGSDGKLPDSGVVRVEVSREFFEGHCTFEDVDRWSRLVCQYRCTDSSYGRASISIAPIVRAEELLGATFPAFEPLLGRFYRATRI